jgi:hypothetical protein
MEESDISKPGELQDQFSPDVDKRDWPYRHTPQHILGGHEDWSLSPGFLSRVHTDLFSSKSQLQSRGPRSNPVPIIPL